jgi:hypothetical protein
MKNCPICNAETKDWENCMGYTLMESESKCVDGCGHYVYYFITGCYEVGVKNASNEWAVWQWSYDMPREEQVRIQTEIDAAIAQAKREHADDLLGYAMGLGYDPVDSEH